ncbi:MAG: HEPN domain-containing protein [Chloroflexota bacterium]
MDTEPWWRQAEADLETAEHLLTGGRWYAVSWFSHQATEKGIKALYIEQAGQPANRIHDLEVLGHRVGAPPAVILDLVLLDPMFGAVRYPNAAGIAPVDRITRGRATRDIEAARRAMAWVKSQL